ncbi:hypothetical protein AVEN_201629-1 [Araneus ventricosus]|uniref:Uncharacterized protein n=1 Tax=Araneus ventricosus TaxID=182803 RepID=A0A4Y2LHS0_ARAVE|nr:hypothetical protein AVEN_201629-1 [Araneus ventricosus]
MATLCIDETGGYRVEVKEMLCTAIQTPFMGMSDKDDSSESDPKSLAQVTIDYKRKANWEKEIESRKRRKHHQRLSPEPPEQLSRNSPHSSPQILRGGSEGSFQIPVSTVSDISPNELENPQQYEFEPRRLPSNCKELLSTEPQLISSNEALPSENLVENSYPSEFPRDSIENYSAIEDHRIIDTSASDPSNDLISFRNLEQSFHVIPKTDHLLQDLPNLLENSDVNTRKKSSFKPNYVFRKCLYETNNNEPEEFSCERRIFQPNFPMNVLLEDEHIISDVRSVFESEGKLKDSTSQTEMLSLHQTVDKDIFQNPADQRNQNCYDWDKFLDTWEGMHLISDSTSEGQHHELETIEEPEISLPTSSPSACTKRKKSFSGQTNKRLHIAESPETIASSSKFSSFEEEHGSNRKFVLHSFEKEVEMMVQPVSSDISEVDTTSKLEKFIKNTKIKLLEEDEIPPFTKQFISLDPENLPNRTNDSFLSNDSYDILQVGIKGIANLLKNQIHVEEISAGTNNTSDKNEELTGVEGDPSVFDNDDNTKMVS